jgi:hypothetical protein
VGLVIGVPLGIALGPVIWKALALNIGVVADSVADLWVIAALMATVLGAAAVLAIGPAFAAARVRPGRFWRTEQSESSDYRGVPSSSSTY